ncbi:type II secretion system ATPase GspE [Candidatus Clavichlamydia salmonicola]|uniref:type II secretion system ATPase GspE n=1 Tax=Candidatus Clavichlamydia salmonicola TaxID=469812 RepID=UPI001E4E4049|nr:type II secretion system ATPase GspE [Candidatus Clavichlamydia salmonicola]
MMDSPKKYENNPIYDSKTGLLLIQVIDDSKVPHGLLQKIPYSFLDHHKIIPIIEMQDKILVAVSEALNNSPIDELSLLLDKPIEMVLVPEEEIVRVLRSSYAGKEGAASDFLAHLSEGEENKYDKSREAIEDSEDLLGGGDEAPIIRLLNLILKEAIKERASDIHFEPFENDLKIRYRIDGVLQGRHSPPKAYRNALITRIKVMASMDIAEHRLPQDGRIKLKIGGRTVDLRVSSVPIMNGERIVLRILDRENVVPGIDQLGMPTAIFEDFRKLITSPEGIILVTGPTGSGKTTTLYGAISDLYKETTNIMTIEDPVEYKFQGISQITVHSKIGMTFSKGLRHILRQDPDVIMIGEIRDSETADIAIRASLTGHLVLSTLHTNDALSALPRLADMGIEPYLLSSTVIGVVAQRLVRKICPQCKESYTPSDAEKIFLIKHHVDPEGKMLFRGKGCSECFGSGYKYRQGIYELLVIDTELRSMMATDRTALRVRELAKKKSFKPLMFHGMELIMKGITTTDEILRVTRSYDD